MADLYIGYGADWCALTRELLQQCGVGERIGGHVVLKPNLVVEKPADSGATTHPEVLEGILQFLQEDCKVESVTIAEGSWVGSNTQRAFKAAGYHKLAEKYKVRLVDTKREKWVKVPSHGYELSVCECFYKADFFINVPVLKGHCQTDITCCLKNLKGCIPDAEKRRFHTMGLHAPIAALACALKPHLHVVDSICGDLTFEEGGNPVEAHRVMVGFDPVLLDSYGAGLMGYEPDMVEHLRLAREWGVGEYHHPGCELVELHADQRPPWGKPRSGIVRELAQHIEEDGACSACYAALVHALHKAGGRRLWGERLKIGQGFRGKEGLPGYGIGNCCCGCQNYAPGCPPRAVDIIDFLTQAVE